MEKETIYIGFSKAKGSFPILSWIIQAIEGTNYSHVYLRIPSAWFERDLYFQASSVMVNFMGPTYFDEHAQMVEEYPIQISSETKKKVWQYCIDNAGKPFWGHNGGIMGFGASFVHLPERRLTAIVLTNCDWLENPHELALALVGGLDDSGETDEAAEAG